MGWQRKTVAAVLMAANLAIVAMSLSWVVWWV